MFTQGTTTSSGAVPVMPLDRRYEQIRYQNADGSCGEVAYPINYAEVYNLKGRLLTVIDATFIDPEQRKAQKDIVWQALRSWMQDIESRVGGPQDGQPSTDA